MTTQFEETKTTTKGKALKTTTSTANLENYAQLYKEFDSNKMEDRKRVALRNKLVSVYRANTIDDTERTFLRRMLVRERSRRELSEPHMLILNEIEQIEYSKKCFVKHPNAPKNLKLKLDTECKYYYGPELGSDGAGRFIVYVPEIIKPEWQVDMPTAMKMMQGHEIPANKLPPEKILWWRLELKTKEFERWFRYADEDLLDDMPNKEELDYKF